MSQSQVISFRASGHFLNWIEAQRLEGESPSQAAQRILKEVSGTSTEVSYLSTRPSTVNSTSVASTEMSTISPDSVDKIVSVRVDPVLERLAAVEERLGKLRA
jgi:hypothetical protein